MDKQECIIMKEYHAKFKCFDWIYAADIVDYGTGDTMGLFAIAKLKFYKGNFIPLFDGWFGEVNYDFWKLLRVLEHNAEAADDGLSLSLLSHSDQKGEEHSQYFYNNS